MKSFEAQLRPVGPESLGRDLFVAGLLLGLAFLLVPAWERTLPVLAPVENSGSTMQDSEDARSGGYRQDVIGQLASVSMLGALGFLLAMRQGAIDLSIWVVMGAGGLAAASAINAGASPWMGFLLAIGLGAAVGAVNAFFVAGLRLPSIIITPLVAVGLIVLIGALTEGREVVLRAGTFDGWVMAVHEMLSGDEPQAGSPPTPLLTVRMVMVATAWSLTLVVLLVRYHMTVADSRDPLRRRPALLAALVASGALAGLAGACWLLDHGRTPVPTRPIDGLVIPTAAVLAGAAILAGRGRTILSCIYLPVATLMVTLWRQVAPPVRMGGFDISVALLAVAVCSCQLGAIWALTRRRSAGAVVPIITAGVMVVGLAVAGWSLRYDHAEAWKAMKVGMAILLVGAALTLGSVVYAFARRLTARQPSSHATDA